MLLFTGSTTAYAAWARNVNLGSGATITTGSMGLTAGWVGTPSFTGWPTETKTAVMRLTQSGQGRWQYDVGPATGPAVTAGAVVTYWVVSGATCSATPLPAGWSPTVLPAGGSADVCVSVQLPAGQVSSLAFNVPVTARNQSTN
ncbi:hypothetical protein [Cellulomonas sp. URHD0024]|uniref:hypothetical protein n=1 Tax=Cellulomonas sp. URHD0024 TaxID=1302620 RepID=UPI00040CCC33|nr:hypothetical protein [Cellulomonas sp. URHD0024]